MPGQTALLTVSTYPRLATFNGGPGNCPAKPDSSESTSSACENLQWRAGQLPGQTAPLAEATAVSASLQWRAGQLPGQTRRHQLRYPDHSPPSMEGRAIARPNASGGRSGPERGVPSMEGRAIARPNRTEDRPPRHGPVPSMEGRAIARPNVTRSGQTVTAVSRLQWRAGQLPGQTVLYPTYRVGRWVPSMEGRAIARPNVTPPTSTTTTVPVLQWRAGQLPGQTCPVHRGARRVDHAFNGGPGNCPAKRHPPRSFPAGRPGSFNGGPGNCPAKHWDLLVADEAPPRPSMEGRAIARPNASRCHYHT